MTQLATPARDPRLGTRIRSFTVVERIARGSVATVYRATDGHQLYALKIYDPRHAEFADLRASIESELIRWIASASASASLGGTSVPLCPS